VSIRRQSSSEPARGELYFVRMPLCLVSFAAPELRSEALELGPVLRLP
jgi:hypothetical protein